MSRLIITSLFETHGTQDMPLQSKRWRAKDAPKKSGLELWEKTMGRWTRENIDQMLALWVSGQSAGQIGGALGVTRNVVIGVVNRYITDEQRILAQDARNALKAARPAPKRKRRRQRPSITKPPPCKIAKPKPFKPAQKTAAVMTAKSSSEPLCLPAAAQPHRTVVSIALHGECRWPIGDPKDSEFHFCGCRCEFERPYCQYHHDIAHQKIETRKVA